MADLDVARLVRIARTNLRRRMARRPIAFVLSGGGSQGSFEVGVLRFLYDDLGLRPSILVGSSVGAIIAAKLAEGEDDETGRRPIDDLEAIWRGLKTNRDMWLTEPWLDKLRSQATWASELRGRAGEHGIWGRPRSGGCEATEHREWGQRCLVSGSRLALVMGITRRGATRRSVRRS